MSKLEALMKKGTTTLGKALIEKAIEKQNESVTNEVVGFVQDMMAKVQNNNEWMEYAKASNEFFERKLQAIEKGEFTVSANGQIQMKDPELQKKALDLPAGLAPRGAGTCRNCGYPINR